MILHEKLKSYRLILASQSPRRRQLLSEAGLKYELAPSFECEELYPADIAAADVAEFLSRLKSEAYPSALCEKDILLTADTVVVAQGEILGKPVNRNEAFAMLKMLSGCEHEVITGVTLRSAKQTKSFSAQPLWAACWQSWPSPRCWHSWSTCSITSLTASISGVCLSMATSP